MNEMVVLIGYFFVLQITKPNGFSFSMESAQSQHTDNTTHTHTVTQCSINILTLWHILGL